MPYNNSNKQTDKEVYTGMGRLIGVTAATMKKYWIEAAYEYIVRTLWLTGCVKIPNLGTFTLRRTAENIQIQRTVDGKEMTYLVPERDVPVFTPHDTFINDVNMMGVTQAYRKRKKNGVLTENDYKRQQRADILGVYGSLSKERIENSEREFSKFLDELKKEKEAEEDAE